MGITGRGRIDSTITYDRRHELVRGDLDEQVSSQWLRYFDPKTNSLVSANSNKEKLRSHQ